MQQTSSSFCAQTIVHAVVIVRALLAVLLSSWISVACANAATENSASNSHGASQESFEFAGLKRNYTLLAPSSAAAAPAPLLVLLHGSYGSGAAMVSWWTSMAEQEGIVLRHSYPESPPRVEYELTDKGRALLPIIDEMRRFGRSWLISEPRKRPRKVAAAR